MEDPAISNGPHYPMPNEIWVDDDGRAWGEAVCPSIEDCTRYVRAPEGSVVLSAGEAEDVKAAFDELMTGVGKIAIQDYARLNRAGIVLARLTEGRE